MLKFTAILIGAIVRVTGEGAPGTRLEFGQLVQVTELTRTSVHVASESGDDVACFTSNEGFTSRLEATEYDAFPAPEPAVEPATAPGTEAGGTTAPALEETQEDQAPPQSEAEVTPPQPVAGADTGGGDPVPEAVVPPAAVAPAAAPVPAAEAPAVAPAPAPAPGAETPA